MYVYIIYKYFYINLVPTNMATNGGARGGGTGVWNLYTSRVKMGECRDRVLTSRFLHSRAPVPHARLQHGNSLSKSACVKTGSCSKCSQEEGEEGLVVLKKGE